MDRHPEVYPSDRAVARFARPQPIP
jgi:hypothetical protein